MNGKEDRSEPMQTFINQLIANKEESPVAFISQLQIQKALEVICAFLNGEGGWLIIGHNGKKVTGLDEFSSQLIDRINKEIFQNIHPVPMVYVSAEEVESKQVILINTLKGPRQPYALKNIFYRWNKSYPIEVKKEEILSVLMPLHDHVSHWETLPHIEGTYSDILIREIEETIKSAREQRLIGHIPPKPRDFLSYFKLLDYEKITNGALVLFGKQPRKHLPQCAIRINQMPDGKTADQFEETVVIEVNLFQATERVEEQVSKIISDFSQPGWRRTTRRKYPTKALDEAVINAIVHRDYSDLFGEITINVFNNKIQITNSGEIPDSVLEGKNVIKPHPSILRNPIIAHMFFFRGFMEKVGRGMTMIVDEFKKNNHRPPEWKSADGYTTLTLFSINESLELNSRIKKFLESTRTEEIYNRSIYEEIYPDISEKTARNDLSKMVQLGFLGKIGRGQATSYIRTSKKLPEITGE